MENELQVKAYADKSNSLVVEDDKSLKVAKILKRQISSLKTLITSSTDVEYREKKDAYDEALKEIKSLKEAYQKIQNSRLSFTKPLSLAFKTIKQKIENYNLQCEQAEQRRIEEEEKLAEEQRRIEEEEKLAEEQRRIEEEEKLAEEQRRISEELKAKEEEAARAEEKRKLDEEKASQEKLAAQKKAETSPEYATLKPDAEVDPICNHGHYPGDCDKCNPVSKLEQGMVVTKETGVTNDGEECPGCDAERNVTKPPPIVHPEEKHEPVTKQKREVRCQVVNLKSFAAGIASGEVPTECMRPHTETLNNYAQGFHNHAKEGDGFFPGCMIVEVCYTGNIS